MLQEGFNKVQVEGYLNAITVREDDTTIELNNGGERKCKYIAVTLEIQPEKDGDNIIPVEAYSKSIKKDGGQNKVYKSLQTVKNFNSIASAGIEGADKISVSTGQLTENVFVTDDGNVVKQARIRSNFFNRVNGKLNPKANFSLEGFVLRMEDGMDSEGIEDGTLVVYLAVAKYGGRIDILEFTVEKDKGVQFFKQHVNTGDTLKVGGDIVFSKKVITETVDESDVGFGEPIVNERTVTNKKLVITTASKPYDSELAYDPKDVQEAVAQREEYIEQQKQQKAKPAKAEGKGNEFSFKGF